MASRTINISVMSPSRIDAGVAKLEQIKIDLKKQCAEFCDEMAAAGVSVARMNVVTPTHDFSNCIYFGREFGQVSKYGCQAIMYGKNVYNLVSADGQKTISPILMAEFGTGINYGVPLKNVDGLTVGAGSYPGQRYALDPNGWYYKDGEGKWHHTMGAAPSYPMQKAYDEMVTIEKTIAKRVFHL